MEIKKLKRAAEFLDKTVKEYEHAKGVVYIKIDTTTHLTFNPHESTGRHWLVEMTKKLDEQQRADFYYKLFSVYIDEYKNNERMDFTLWAMVAPSELCFEKIMEVIK